MAVNAHGMVGKGVRGSIVCTASLAAQYGSETATDYSMLKHAVLGLVRSAIVQLAVRRVRLNYVSPGVVGTPLVSESSKLGRKSCRRR
ncbi:putative oxidoreductase [Rosa chinensis]|uniref:Putative oxidoreductase n=1 Tax=Rosa chinensis TaxID=74649 RepID=A0A2P6PGH6_ROSCH|nr:putative oxidoreductase [Rosa chinensis]